MITEKATYDPDLPHQLIREAASADCVCGRPANDQLHTGVPVAQKAAAKEVLVRQFGS